MLQIFKQREELKKSIKSQICNDQIMRRAFNFCQNCELTIAYNPSSSTVRYKIKCICYERKPLITFDKTFNMEDVARWLGSK